MGYLKGVKPAVFLDRDGTLIFDRHYLADPDGVELFPGAARVLRELQDGGFAVVVITNQSGVGRGLISPQQLDAVHRELNRQLEEKGAALEAIYACPHTPQDGCDCRKPGTALLERAARQLGLDLASSYMIGDKPSDIRAALAAGATPILVGTGQGAESRTALVDLRHSFEFFETLKDAAEWILETRR